MIRAQKGQKAEEGLSRPRERHLRGGKLWPCWFAALVSWSQGGCGGHIAGEVGWGQGTKATTPEAGAHDSCSLQAHFSTLLCGGRLTPKDSSTRLPCPLAAG